MSFFLRKKVQDQLVKNIVDSVDMSERDPVTHESYLDFLIRLQLPKHCEWCRTMIPPTAYKCPKCGGPQR